MAQLSFAINIFLSFAIASLGYAIHLKLEQTVSDTIQVDLPLVLFSASAILGCLATITRLLDYRYTARKIREGGSLNTWMAEYCGPMTWAFSGGSSLHTRLAPMCLFLQSSAHDNAFQRKPLNGALWRRE